MQLEDVCKEIKVFVHAHTIIVQAFYVLLEEIEGSQRVLTVIVASQQIDDIIGHNSVTLSWNQ